MASAFYNLVSVFSFLLFSLPLFSQKITGRVTDREGEAIPFASISVKGSGTGTHSNAEGKYTLALRPGTYEVVCQHVGYSTAEKTVELQAGNLELNFTLEPRELTLEEVVLDQSEDPAYEIIRNAIRAREEHQKTFNRFTCEVYTKGQLKLLDYPDKLLGQKIDFEDGDTSKRKMIYLSETISTYSVDGPGRQKIEVLSSRVSGQSDGFGLSAPAFLSFYQNNIMIGNNLNPRGFISPVADNALNVYSYKLEGTYFEGGREVAHIRVTPRRKFEPLFSGHIDIVIDDWRIHSLKLLLTKSSQMELVDSLRVEQLHRPLDNGTWFISSQVLYPVIRIFGFDARGSFVNIYSRINTDPAFVKKHFGSTILKYTDSANKKSPEFWDNNRPIPLLEEELTDYRRKDSLEIVRRDPRYLDSLDRVRNRFRPTQFLLVGQTFTQSRKRSTVSVQALAETVNFNPAEGLVIDPTITYSKRLDSALSSRRTLTVSQTVRYGFGNGHLNPYLTVQYNFGKNYLHSLRLSGGRRVFQFNNESPIGQRGNTLSSLLEENNRIKSYEAAYFRGSYRQNFGAGVNIVAGFQFQDRSPLDNVTDYTWRDKEGRAYTPNYPSELMAANILRHQAFLLVAGISWQPGTRYIELPDRKFSIGSKYPVLNLQVLAGLPGLAGSDVDFTRWKFSVSDGINLKLLGRFRYRLAVGGFLNKNRVEVPDYNHFNGNISTLATEYLNSFQLLPIYRFSNTANAYSLAHLEHNFNGFLTNWLPGIRKLNLYLVVGANTFYIDRSRNYFEWFAGLDNIFKQIRVDFVQSYIQGQPNHSAIRIGLRNAGGRRDDW